MFFGGQGGDPFGGGGNPFGGGGGGGGPPRGDVDTTKLYETLGVEKTASKKDIRKAYMKQSRIHHPDKGGDEHKFKEISAAYEILSDEESRAQYDRYGLEGVSGDDVGSAGGEDLFSMFFGGGGRSSRRAGPQKGPPVNHPLKVSLSDLFNGKTVKLAVNRKVIQGTPTECPRCKGQGAIMEMRQIGPGMITQMQRPCDVCKGQGQQCSYKSERKVLEVHVEKGMRDNDKITFRGMSDEVPKMEPGDINFIIKEKDHELFKRKGADLLAVKEVSLNQALCGFTWKIKHLDDRVLVIKSKPGEIIKPEMNTTEGLPFVKVLPDEGMPSKGNPFVRGNLYVMFRVKFPKDNSLPPETVAALKKLLPEPDVEEEYDPMEVEEVHLNTADLRSFGKGGASQSSSMAHDSDDEDGGRPVQCQQS